MNSYQKGDLVRVTGTFTDEDGAYYDPEQVYVQYENPAGTTTTKQYDVDLVVVKSATGRYYLDISADSTGHWFYRWYSTGAGQAADEEEFFIEESRF